MVMVSNFLWQVNLMAEFFDLYIRFGSIIAGMLYGMLISKDSVKFKQVMIITPAVFLWPFYIPRLNRAFNGKV